MIKVEKIKSKNYTLVNGDCLNYLNQIPDNSIDLILTDPPYNIAQYSTGNIDLPGRSALNNDLGEWDLKEIDPFVMVSDFKRILKPDGNIFIYIITHYRWSFSKIISIKIFQLAMQNYTFE